MHAAVIPVTFNDKSAAESELSGVVSQVSGMPGFVAGYWVALSQDKGIATIVFDSEEAARSVATMAQNGPPGAVTAHDIEVGEVMAHA